MTYSKPITSNLVAVLDEQEMAEQKEVVAELNMQEIVELEKEEGMATTELEKREDRHN